MADATFEWLVQNPWVMREYAFRWLAVGEDGVVFDHEDLDELLARVVGSGLAEQVRLVYAYAAEDSGAYAGAGSHGSRHYV
jgi:hypothetical protein